MNLGPLLTDDPGTTAYDPGSDANNQRITTGKIHVLDLSIIQ